MDNDCKKMSGQESEDTQRQLAYEARLEAQRVRNEISVKRKKKEKREELLSNIAAYALLALTIGAASAMVMLGWVVAIAVAPFVIIGGAVVLLVAYLYSLFSGRP